MEEFLNDGTLALLIKLVLGVLAGVGTTAAVLGKFRTVLKKVVIIVKELGDTIKAAEAVVDDNTEKLKEEIATLKKEYAELKAAVLSVFKKVDLPDVE